MSEIDYSKTELIKKLNVPEKITVIGCGGTGAWVCLLSAIAGVGSIQMFDPAKVTATGLSRLPFQRSELGVPKVDAVARLLKSVRPDIKLILYNRFFDVVADEKLLEKTVFNCSDSAEFAKQLSHLISKKDYRHVFAPYSGLSAGVFSTVPPATILDGTGGSWVGSAALAASLAVTSAFGDSFETVINPSTARVKSRDLGLLGHGGL